MKVAIHLISDFNIEPLARLLANSEAAPVMDATVAPFGQVESTLSRKYEGTGLGLPLAKHLTEMHGGTLSLESKVNVGTTVTIFLPPERIIEESMLPPAVKAIA